MGLPLGVAGESSHHRMMVPSPLVELRTRVQTLQLCVQAACDVAFPVETADNPVTIEERLLALPVRLRARVTEAIHHGAATVLATA